LPHAVESYIYTTQTKTMSGSNANAANVFTYHYAKAAEKTYTNKQ